MPENDEKGEWLKILKEMQLRRWGFSSLPEWLKGFSAETWVRIGFGLRNWSLKTLETTITQNLVFEFDTYAQQRVMPIKLLESRDERSNGNDLEIVVETSRGYLIFPVQAKIIDEQYRYPSVKYKNANGYQLDLLLDYARKKKGIPFYLFYNTCDDARIIGKIIKGDPGNILFLGCSLADAHQLKANYFHPATSISEERWSIPDFESIHITFGIPLYHLAHRDLAVLGVAHQESSGNSVAYYSAQEIMKDPGWRVRHPRGIGFLPPERTAPTSTALQSPPDKVAPSFNPRFRLVIARPAAAKP